MEQGEEHWVLVKRPAEREWWNPSSTYLQEDDGHGGPPLKRTFNEPAKYFTDAIPIGNGRLGAMIWGGVASETLQLNEDTLWTGIPGENYTNPNTPETLKVVRKLVDNGKYLEATTEAEKLSGGASAAYQLVRDIKLEFDNSHLQYPQESYIRQLEFETVTARVKYSIGDVEFTREHFASNPDQVIVTKISESK